MAEHSKVASSTSQIVMDILIAALIGSPQRKAFSGAVLVIIGYLIYMKNKKSSTENIRLK